MHEGGGHLVIFLIHTDGVLVDDLAPALEAVPAGRLQILLVQSAEPLKLLPLFANECLPIQCWLLRNAPSAERQEHRMTIYDLFFNV